MRRKSVTLLVVCITVIVAVSLFATLSSFAQNSSISVIRNFDTTNEEHALTTAEKTEYSTIYASIRALEQFESSNDFRGQRLREPHESIGTLERFEGSNDPEAYIHPKKYISYTWANFIDTAVIDYYQNRYNHQQKQISPKGVTFTYNAKATYLEQLHIFNSTQLEQGTKFVNNNPHEKETITWNSRIIVFDDPDNSSPLIKTKPFEYMLYKNQSEYCTLTSEFDLNFSNCYLIEMEIHYEETYNPLAGFFVRVYQIVVLDQNLVPVWIGINPALHIVA